MATEELLKRNIGVFSDTLGVIENEFKDEVAKSIENTKIYSANSFSEVKFDSEEMKIELISSDMILATIELSEKYPMSRIGLLNFSDPNIPGGSVSKGAVAQEEDLCRCTTLYPVLKSDKCFYSYYLPNRKTKTWNSLEKVIYSPNIRIFKDSSYNRIDPVVVDVISAAAPCLINPEWRYDYDLTYESHKIKDELILHTALANGVKILVLGAFGCGCFFNNPYAVVTVFRELLNGVYKGAFERVIFAISKGTNFDIFKENLFRDSGGIQ